MTMPQRAALSSVSRSLVEAGEVVRQRLLGAPGFISEYDITLSTTLSQWHVEAVAYFAPGTGRGLLPTFLEVNDGPLRLERQPNREVISREHGRWLAIRPHVPKRLVMQLTSSIAPDCLALPDSVPMLFGKPGSILPLPRLNIATSDAQLHLGWLQAHGAQPTLSRLSGALQVSVLRSTQALTTLRIQPEQSLTLSPRIKNAVRDCESLASTIAKHLRCLEVLLGKPGNLRLPVVAREDLAGFRWFPTGALVVLDSEQCAALNQGRDLDLALAQQVAGVWFGGGLRFAGRGANELTMALQHAAGLHCFSCENDPVVYAEVLSRYEAAARDAPPAWQASSEDAPSTNRVARLALDCLRLLQSELGQRHLKDKVGMLWGHQAAAAVFLAFLREHG